MPIVQVNPVINYDTIKWCALPYPGHKKGCPNLSKGCLENVTFFDKYYDLTKPVYAVYMSFDVGAHAKRMKQKYPNWSERQCYNLLYWQPKARKQFRPIVMDFCKEYPDYYICSPEGMGVDVVATMKRVGIELIFPPRKTTYLIVFAGIKNKITREKRTSVLI